MPYVCAASAFRDIRMPNPTPSWGPSAHSLRSQEPRTFADQALLRIRQDIVAGRLGAGQKLQPDLLEAEYGIGRSPIREALSRLATEGLVLGEGQRGFQVSPVTRDELLDIADLRKRFSSLALARSIARGDDAWEADVVASYHRLQKIEDTLQSTGVAEAADEFEKRNRAFHTSLESASGSPWLNHFCELLYDQSERYRRSFVRYPEISESIKRQHKAILDASMARDANLACRLLEDHIEAGAQNTLRLITASPEPAEARDPKGAKAGGSNSRKSGNL